MSTAVHRATKTVTPSEAPRNGALSGRDLLSRLPTEDVETPVGRVTVRALGAKEMMDLAPRAQKEDATQEEQVALAMEVAALGLDLTAEETARLPISVLMPIFGAVMRLSGATPEAIEEAVEGLKALPNDES